MSDPAPRRIAVEPAALATSPANPPFTAGNAIGGALRVFGGNALAFGGVALAFFAPAILVEMATVSAPDSSGAWRISTTLWNVLGCLVTAGLTRGTLDALEGRTPGVSAMFGAGFVRGLRVLGASMLVGLLTVLGLILLLVPGLSRESRPPSTSTRASST